MAAPAAAKRPARKAARKAAKAKPSPSAPKPKITPRHIDPVRHYAESVIAGDVIACNAVRQACERHLLDLKNPDLRFDLDAAKGAFAFFGELRHYSGDWAGMPFALENWQEFVVGSIFGWKWKASGLRRFIRALVHVPRKNGKTFLAAGIALYMLVVDGEPAPQVYSVATKEKQARLAWRDAKKIVKYCKTLNRLLRCKVDVIEFEGGDGLFAPLGSDSDTLDGLNPHCSVGDEVHAWKSRDLYDVLDDAMGARSQPLFLLISTAGYFLDGIYATLLEHLRNILSGGDGYRDDSTFGVIYEADNADNWADEVEWRKANPNLGVSKTWAYMRDQCNQAKLQKGKLNAFKNKQLNLWVRADERWLGVEQWKACRAGISLDQVKGKSCVLGLDLASTSDFTAIALVFPPDQTPDGKWWVFTRQYLPQESLDDDSKRKKYLLDILRKWADAGHIYTTPGNVTDYSYIVSDIKKLAEDFKIREAVIDPFNASQVSVDLENAGIKVVHFYQKAMNFNAPMQKLETLVLKGEIAHEGNPVMTWQAGNVVALEDSNGNIKPDRKKSSEKIDGVVATLMGIGRWMVEPDGGSKQSVYETRGMRTL